jgi:hypothetical protein
VRRRFESPIIIALSHDLRNLPLRITPEQQSRDDATGRQSEARAETPRSEPEISPPGVDLRPQPGHEPVFGTRNSIRVYVTQPGPLGIAAILVGAGILGALSFLLLLGTLLIAAAAAGTLVVIALIARLLARFRD